TFVVGQLIAYRAVRHGTILFDNASALSGLG
ncbi:MAG: hypothetical protein QG615_420, partial [Nitrospirota bacterium]|nr:hypothetical protein [Nitrospirota bacterium]